MHLYTKIFNLTIPSYGLMVLIGAIAANIVALLYLYKRKDLDKYDFILTEVYALVGGFLGAKILYIITVAKYIDWSHFFEKGYFKAIMTGGFVMYGGLIGALLFVFLGKAIHKIDVIKYVREFIFAFPLAHGFGRIGCFMAGCCYGVPYDGPISVVFPEESMAPPGIHLFPVQLFEAIFLFVIFGILLFVKIKFSFKYPIELYFLLYGVLRIFTEALRYDEIRGKFLGVSTSQWISFILIGYGIISIVIKKHIQKKSKEVAG